jgi:hypothetical protein
VPGVGPDVQDAHSHEANVLAGHLRQGRNYRALAWPRA